MIRLNRWNWLLAVGLGVGFLHGSLVFASEAPVVVDPLFVPPSWLQYLMLIVHGIPALGPILLEIGKYAAVAMVLCTGVAFFLRSLSKAFEGFSHLSPHFMWAGKIADFIDSIHPWLAYFAGPNVSRKPWQQDMLASKLDEKK